MTIQTNSTHRSFASLKLPRKAPALIPYARSIQTAMTANARLSNPTPTIAQLDAAITALATAEAATLTRTKGAVATRNTARTALVKLLQQLKGYVQTAADADAENGAAIIESAGIAVRKTAVKAARAFTAAQGPTTGSAKLVAGAAARRASYEWDYSTDGGKTWVPATPTLQAQTVIPGLAVGTTVQFRYRGVTRTGVVDWSTPVSLLVK